MKHTRFENDYHLIGPQMRKSPKHDIFKSPFYIRWCARIVCHHLAKNHTTYQMSGKAEMVFEGQKAVYLKDPHAMIEAQQSHFLHWILRCSGWYVAPIHVIDHYKLEDK